MRAQWLIAIPFLIAGWSSTALATDAVCEGCSYANMEGTAKSLGMGNHRVASISTNEIYGFHVSCPANGQTEGADAPANREALGPLKTYGSKGGTISSGCSKPLRAEWRDVSVAAINAINAANEFWGVNSGDMARIEVDLTGVPQTFAQSVTHVLNDYPARQAMFDHILANQNTIEKFLNIAQANILAALSILPNSIVVSIKFQDGSTVNVNWDAAAQLMTLVPTTSRGANGVALIEGNSANYAGNYSVTGMNLQGYLSYLSSLGVPVSTSGSGSGGSMTCSWNGLTTTLTCSLNLQ